MRKTIISVILTLTLFSTPALTQTYNWVELPNSPNADGSRNEDVYFTDANTGYAISYSGKVYRTSDGGANWITITEHLSNANRSVGFFTSATGIIGTLDSSNILFRTTDGGISWSMISPSIQGTVPKGICGISIVDSNTAYAVGRYYPPAGLIRTTNGGLNWTSIPLDTSLIRSAVDCKFWSLDSGFIAGGYSINMYNMNSKAVVLMTTDGGKTFTRRYITAVPALNGEWCWKIQFISRMVGYTSIQYWNNAVYLKTTDGGLNWTRNEISGYQNIQSIGFINETTGWIGGWGSSGNMPTIETTNGGLDWHTAGWGFNVNRFRFLNDTLAYAIGNRVFKYMRSSVGVQQTSSEVPDSYILNQNYPNPFNPSTRINFSLPKSGFVTLKVFDATGKQITGLVNQNLVAGEYEYQFDASKLTSGVYFYTLRSGDFSETKKMLLVK